MGDTPRFGIRFTSSPTDAPLAIPTVPARSEPGARDRPDRVRVYGLALELAAHISRVVERADAERYFLRDQLERTSLTIPQLVAQGLAVIDLPGRRALYERARRALTNCTTILDLLVERGAVAPEVVAPVHGLAQAVVEELRALTVPPPRVW